MNQMGFEIDNLKVAIGAPLFLIAGPCVLEDESSVLDTAGFLKELTDKIGIPYIFKSSYDKANRTSIESYRGPGIRRGLEILSKIKDRFGVPVLSDVHRISEVKEAATVLDVIQIPAFLCRQTDLLLAVAETKKPINIKKGQFLAPWDMAHVAQKAASTGNNRIFITERGTMFGYNNLVSDLRSIKLVQDLGYPVVFDATHSVQLPGGANNRSGGQREFAPILAKAAVAAGADGIFIEVHKNPNQALCDGPNSLKLDDVEALLIQLKSIRDCITAE